MFLLVSSRGLIDDFPGTASLMLLVYCRSATSRCRAVGVISIQRRRFYTQNIDASPAADYTISALPAARIDRCDALLGATASRQRRPYSEHVTAGMCRLMPSRRCDAFSKLAHDGLLVSTLAAPCAR